MECDFSVGQKVVDKWGGSGTVTEISSKGIITVLWDVRSDISKKPVVGMFEQSTLIALIRGGGHSA